MTPIISFEVHDRAVDGEVEALGEALNQYDATRIETAVDDSELVEL